MAKPGSEGLKEAEPIDPTLAELTRLWPSVPASTRKALLDLARSMSANQGGDSTE